MVSPRIWGLVLLRLRSYELFSSRYSVARGFTNVWIESDLLTAINLIKQGCRTTHSCHGLVDIKKNASQIALIQFLSSP
jgi:hypothetical protein